MKSIQQFSKWQTTLLQLHPAHPKTITRRLGTNVLARRTQMGETTVRKEGGVTTVDGAIVGEEEETGAEGGVEMGASVRITRDVGVVVVKRKGQGSRGRWGGGSGGSLINCPRLLHD